MTRIIAPATGIVFQASVVGGAGGGTSMTDNTAYIPGVTALTPTGFIYQSPPANIIAGNAGAARMSQDRIVLVGDYVPNPPVFSETLSIVADQPIPAGAGAGTNTANYVNYTVGVHLNGTTRCDMQLWAYAVGPTKSAWLEVFSGNYRISIATVTSYAETFNCRIWDRMAVRIHNIVGVAGGGIDVWTRAW